MTRTVQLATGAFLIVVLLSGRRGSTAQIPVHVEPAHPEPAKTGAQDVRKDKEDDKEHESGGTAHGHMVHVHSGDADDVWQYSKDQMDRWNARCDRVINSRGALRRIVLLDLATPEASAPFRLSQCKQATISSRDKSNVSSIIALDTMQRNKDEAGLEATERLLKAAHNRGWPYTSADAAIRYLAVRTSKRCQAAETLMIEQWSKISPHGPTNMPGVSDFAATRELLYHVARYNYYRPTAPSDKAGLNDAYSVLSKEAREEKNLLWQRQRLAALNRVAARLRPCFQQ